MRTSENDCPLAPAYSAPEVFRQKVHNTKIDIWALGIILYKLVSSGAHPFESKDYHKIIKLITDEEPKPLAPSVSPFIQKLIRMLLDKNPDTRPDANLLIELPEI